ncbi:MAG TPA: hypothetical protein VK631_24530, partial [Solirubrobacteraceae bacterium]|nr:hypothetical protein [Solirubrobacteraceae bacterium]
MIEAGRAHPDEHLVHADLGALDLLELQHIGIAVRALDDGFHDTPFSWAAGYRTPVSSSDTDQSRAAVRGSAAG